MIRGDSIVSLGHSHVDSVFLLQQPAVNYDPTDQCATADADVRNGGNTSNLPGKNMRQMRPRNTEVVGGRLDVHDLAINECLWSIPSGEIKLFPSERNVGRTFRIRSGLGEVQPHASL